MRTLQKTLQALSPISILRVTLCHPCFIYNLGLLFSTKEPRTRKYIQRIECEVLCWGRVCVVCVCEFVFNRGTLEGFFFLFTKYLLSTQSFKSVTSSNVIRVLFRSLFSKRDTLEGFFSHEISTFKMSQVTIATLSHAVLECYQIINGSSSIPAWFPTCLLNENPLVVSNAFVELVSLTKMDYFRTRERNGVRQRRERKRDKRT